MKIVEILDNVKNTDRLVVICQEDSKLAVGHEAADKCIVVGMVNGRDGEKQLLKRVHCQVSVNFHLKLKFRKQLLQIICQCTNKYKQEKAHYLLVTRDLRSFKIRFQFESAVRFDSKVIGRFGNFRIESAVPAARSS